MFLLPWEVLREEEKGQEKIEQAENMSVFTMNPDHRKVLKVPPSLLKHMKACKS